jgi:hypothetical protein
LNNQYPGSRYFGWHHRFIDVRELLETIHAADSLLWNEGRERQVQEVACSDCCQMIEIIAAKVGLPAVFVMPSVRI